MTYELVREGKDGRRLPMAVADLRFNAGGFVEAVEDVGLKLVCPGREVFVDMAEYEQREQVKERSRAARAIIEDWLGNDFARFGYYLSAKVKQPDRLLPVPSVDLLTDPDIRRGLKGIEDVDRKTYGEMLTKEEQERICAFLREIGMKAFDAFFNHPFWTYAEKLAEYNHLRKVIIEDIKNGDVFFDLLFDDKDWKLVVALEDLVELVEDK